MNPVLKFLRHQFQSLCSCKSQRQQTFSRLCKECSSKINKLLLQTCLKISKQNYLTFLWHFMRTSKISMTTLTHSGKTAFTHWRCCKQARETTSQRKYPVDTRTKNVRTKDVHKRTFIFGSIWKHGKTSQSKRVMNVPIWYV